MLTLLTVLLSISFIQFLPKIVSVCRSMSREKFYAPEVPKSGPLGDKQRQELEELSKLDVAETRTEVWLLMKKPVGKDPSLYVHEEDTTTPCFSNCSVNMAGHHLKEHHGRIVSLATDPSTGERIV